MLAFHRGPQGDLAAEPERPSPIRLVGSVLAEQNDEWIEGRRYLGLDVLARSRITLIPTDHTSRPLAPNQQEGSRVNRHARGLDPKSSDPDTARSQPNPLTTINATEPPRAVCFRHR